MNTIKKTEEHHKCFISALKENRLALEGIEGELSKEGFSDETLKNALKDFKDACISFEEASDTLIKSFKSYDKASIWLKESLGNIKKASENCLKKLPKE